MILFIRKIPTNTRYSDIAGFVEPALKGGLFRRPGRIVKIEIIGFRDLLVHCDEFHALVSVEPDTAGFRAVKMLKGKRLNNQLVLVRQYFQRNWHNDRRQNYQSAPEDMIEKRHFDRRRGKSLETILDISGHFSNAGDFSRKGG